MGYNLDFGINSTWYITNYSNPYATLVFSSGDSSISVRAYAGTPANTYTVTVSGTGGGGVCSRALFYNLNLAKWGVRA